MKTGKYLAVLVITSIIFFSGIAIGEYLGTQDVDRVLALQEDLQNNVAALNLQAELLETDICDIDIFDITEEKFELGRRLEILEVQLGYDDSDVLRLKNKYSLYAIQQYVLVERQKAQCRDSVEPILFFYDNVDELSDSRTQGYILDYVYRNNKNSVAVFAFSMNVHNPAVDTLIEKYDIDSAPAIVIEGNTYEGVVTSQEILELL